MCLLETAVSQHFQHKRRTKRMPPAIPIIIVVSDRPAKKQKEFTCAADVLRREMRYFEPMVNTIIARREHQRQQEQRDVVAKREKENEDNGGGATEAESGETPRQGSSSTAAATPNKISVNCDLGVFEWLFAWMVSTSTSVDDDDDHAEKEKATVTAAVSASSHRQQRRLRPDGFGVPADAPLGGKGLPVLRAAPHRGVGKRC